MNEELDNIDKQLDSLAAQADQEKATEGGGPGEFVPGDELITGPVQTAEPGEGAQASAMVAVEVLSFLSDRMLAKMCTQAELEPDPEIINISTDEKAAMQEKLAIAFDSSGAEMPAWLLPYKPFIAATVTVGGIVGLKYMAVSDMVAQAQAEKKAAQDD